MFRVKNYETRPMSKFVKVTPRILGLFIRDTDTVYMYVCCI